MKLDLVLLIFSPTPQVRERADQRSEGMNEAFGAVQELQQAVRYWIYKLDFKILSANWTYKWGLKMD